VSVQIILCNIHTFVPQGAAWHPLFSDIWRSVPHAAWMLVVVAHASFLFTQLVALATPAFQSFVRAYACHEKSLRSVFHVRSLHLGHVAKSFALQRAPGALVRASDVCLLLARCCFPCLVALDADWPQQLSRKGLALPHAWNASASPEQGEACELAGVMRARQAAPVLFALANAREHMEKTFRSDAVVECLDATSLALS
jgi:hypothetical protein